MASSPSSKRASDSSKRAQGATRGKAPASASYSKGTGSAARPTDGMTTVERFIWICLHVLVFAVPIAISNANWAGASFALPLTYDQFDIVKVFVMRAAALAGLAAWVLAFFMNGGKIRRTKLDWLILAFLAWVLLTSFTSISPATALFGKYRRFEGFFSFLTYAITYFLVVQLVDRPSRIRSIARTLVFSSLIVAGYGVAQWRGIDPINWGSKLPFETNRGFSTFGNPDLLGGFLIFPLAISISMALSEKVKGWRAFYWAVFLITVLAWITAFVRGAWLGGLAALLIVVIAAVLAKVKLEAVDWGAIGVTALAAAFPVAVSLTSENPVLNVLERFKSIFAFGAGSALTRFEIWDAAWQSIKARPILGWGADTFRLVFPQFKPAAYTRDAGYLSVADNVHNYPLQLASGIGVLGFLLLYGIFGFALWLGLPNAFSRGKGPDRLVITGFWAAALGYIVNLMTGLSVTGSSIFLWIALAIIVSPTAREQTLPVRSWMPAVGIVLAGTIGAAWCYNFVWIAADHYYVSGQFPPDAAQGVADLKTAISLNPWNDQYRAQLGQTYSQGAIQMLMSASQAQQQGKDPAEVLRGANEYFQLADQTLRDTIEFVPTEYDNYVFLSSLYNQWGAYVDSKYLTRAIDVADIGIQVEPYGPAVRFQKALAYYTKRDYANAAKTLKPTVDMDPNYTDPRDLYTQTLIQMGDLKEAKKQLDVLTAIQPTNEEYKTRLKSVEASLAAGKK